MIGLSPEDYHIFIRRKGGSTLVVTLKNRAMWGEARFGGTFGVEVGLPARGDMRILM